MIGICDSGVGGLIVYQKLTALLPDARFVYLADQAYAPYGERSQEEITIRMRQVVQFLVDQGATLVVIACNTATVNAIDELRTQFPDTPIVGMEPAIKPAALAATKILVLGTNSTVHNPRYRALVDQYAAQHTVWNIGAPELVRQVEAGDLSVSEAVAAKIQPYVDQGAEAVVIGCSHFSFLVPAIQERWPSLQIFDGADGVARRAATKAQELAVGIGGDQNHFFTTGTVAAAHFLSPPITFESVSL